MIELRKRYEGILSNCVSGYRWVHFLNVEFREKAIAVYLYIIYIIIFVPSVPGVPSETVYAQGTGIVFHTIVVGTLVTWVHSAVCYRKHKSYMWVHSGYTRVQRWEQ